MGRPGQGTATSSRWRPGVVVRDQYPDRFLDAHVALFAARHDEGLDLRVPEVVAGVLDGAGVPGDKVVAEAGAGGAGAGDPPGPRAGGRPSWEVFGVPTFVLDDRAVFVRLMSRPAGRRRAGPAHRFEGVLDLFDAQPDLNEFKYTTLSH